MFAHLKLHVHLKLVFYSQWVLLSQSRAKNHHPRFLVDLHKHFLGFWFLLKPSKKKDDYSMLGSQYQEE